MTAHRPNVGLLLRLLGPPVEFLCVLGIVKYRGQGQLIFGRPVEPILYMGLAVGFAMVVVGLILSQVKIRRGGEEN